MPHQPQRGRTGRTLVARTGRGAALAGGLALLTLATACGGGGGGSVDGGQAETSAVSAPSAGVVAPAKVEVIANLIGCKVKIRTDADELREGVCRTADGDYLITTFPAEKYKVTWLESAAIYGGRYLVGPQWAISAKPRMLEPLRTKVGGTIRDLDAERTAGTAPGAP